MARLSLVMSPERRVYQWTELPVEHVGNMRNAWDILPVCHNKRCSLSPSCLASTVLFSNYRYPDTFVILTSVQYTFFTLWKAAETYLLLDNMFMGPYSVSTGREVLGGEGPLLMASATESAHSKYWKACLSELTASLWAVEIQI